MDFSQVGIGGVAAAGVIYGIVQLAADLGWVSGQQKRLLALAVAVVLFSGYQVHSLAPQWAPVIEAVYAVIAMSVWASNIYDVSRRVGTGKGST